MLKKVLFNSTTNIIGGAVQTAVNFIRQNFLLPNEQISWHYAVSAKISDELAAFNLFLPNSLIMPVSPARSLTARKKLLAFEKEINPDIVFTMSGPAYVKFEHTHVLGCSNGYVSHPNKYSWNNFGSGFEKNFAKLTILYKKYWFRFADYWVFQTELSRKGFIKQIKVPKERTRVIANACSDLFMKNINRLNRYDEQEDAPFIFRILIPSAYFKHKNLDIVPFVAKEMQILLEGSDLKYEFIFTLPTTHFNKIADIANSLGVNENIKNIGTFSVSDATSVYEHCNLMFLPTLFETFSVSYLEAMAMNIPIVTSDLEFAREICGDAAVYFAPDSAKEAAKLILSLIQNKRFREEKIYLGKEQLKKYPTVEERHRAFLDFFGQLIN